MSEQATNEDGVPAVLDLDDPYFDGQSLPDALRDYEHVHSTSGVCVKNISGRFCDESDKDAILAQHQFAPKYPVVCSCGFSAGFAMDSETPWLHHVALVLREAGFTAPDNQIADLQVTRVLPPSGSDA